MPTHSSFQPFLRTQRCKTAQRFHISQLPWETKSNGEKKNGEDTEKMEGERTGRGVRRREQARIEEELTCKASPESSEVRVRDGRNLRASGGGKVQDVNASSIEDIHVHSRHETMSSLSVVWLMLSSPGNQKQILPRYRERVREAQGGEGGRGDGYGQEKNPLNPARSGDF
jgi:hypothetical protein